MKGKRVDIDGEIAGLRIQFVTTAAWVAEVDEYRATQRPIPSRADVIRVAVAEWIAAQSRKEFK